MVNWTKAGVKLGAMNARFPRAVGLLLVLTVLGFGVLPGLWYYSVQRANYIDRSIADAEVLLAFTDSYVGTYADVVAQHGTSDAPVPATYRAQALLAYNAGRGKRLHDSMAMVGVPGHEVAVSADDPLLRKKLLEMDAKDTPARYSELVHLHGQSTLRTVFPSIANKQSCVDCHNSLEGQQRIWQLGDMMGAFVAERDVGLPLAHIRNTSLLVGVLSACLLWTVMLLVSKNHSLQSKSRQLRHMADTDPLTDCLNRRAFFDRISSERSGNESIDEDRWLLLLDLDHFKSINDEFGHAVGYQVLADFASRIRSQIRDNDRFARIGGEEFALLLQGKPNVDFNAIAERLVRSVERMEVFSGSTRVPVTVSAGMIKVPAGETGWYERCMRLADAALYQAKEMGRNRIIVHS